MDKLEAHRIFFAVVEHGSFTAAAHTLGIDASRASRAIASLEADLGAVLLRRSTRAVALTDEGATYLEAARAAVTDLDQAASILSSHTNKPKGLLTISAPLSFGRLHVLPVIANLLQAHPEFDVRLRLMDRVVSLAEEGVDLAIRIGKLSDSSLQATHLAETRQILTASPAYIDRATMPKKIADLTNHQLISTENPTGAMTRWHFKDDKSLKVKVRLQVNSADAAVCAASNGLGIARTYSYQAARELADGNLIRLLQEYEPPAAPINALYQAGRKNTPNIKSVIEALTVSLKQHTF